MSALTAKMGCGHGPTEEHTPQEGFHSMDSEVAKGALRDPLKCGARKTRTRHGLACPAWCATLCALALSATACASTSSSDEGPQAPSAGGASVAAVGGASGAPANLGEGGAQTSGAAGDEGTMAGAAGDANGAAGAGGEPSGEALLSVVNTLDLSFAQSSGTGFLISDLVAFRVDYTGQTTPPDNITYAANVVVGGVWGTYGQSSTKTGYVTRGRGLTCGPDYDAKVGQSVHATETLSGTVDEGIWSFQFWYTDHYGPGDTFSYYSPGALLTALSRTLIIDSLGLKIPRFRGHPNWRENAPGVDHGQEEEAT